MIFILICLAGIVFVVVTLPGAVRRSKRVRGQMLYWDLPKQPERHRTPYWKKDMSHWYPDTTAGYLDGLKRHQESPQEYPAPFPPPHLRSDPE